MIRRWTRHPGCRLLLDFLAGVGLLLGAGCATPPPAHKIGYSGTVVLGPGPRETKFFLVPSSPVPALLATIKSSIKDSRHDQYEKDRARPADDALVAFEMPTQFHITRADFLYIHTAEQPVLSIELREWEQFLYGRRYLVSAEGSRRVEDVTYPAFYAWQARPVAHGSADIWFEVRAGDETGARARLPGTLLRGEGRLDNQSRIELDLRPFAFLGRDRPEGLTFVFGTTLGDAQCEVTVERDVFRGIYRP